ncbi:MAG: signal recognition particle-docking protein FtsY, partial [Oxalobacteraceae bacterium]
MFSFFKRKSKDTPPEAADAAPAPATVETVAAAAAAAAPPAVIEPAESTAETRASWMRRLKAGLSRTSTGLTTLFVGARIDEELYEELEAALLMADAGVEATQFLLNGLKRRVREQKLTDASQVKIALRALMIELLT